MSAEELPSTSSSNSVSEAVALEVLPGTPSSIIPKTSLDRFQFKNTLSTGGSIRIRLNHKENKFIKEHEKVEGFIDVKITKSLDETLSKKLVLRCKGFERHMKKKEGESIYEMEKEHVYFLDYLLIQDFSQQELEVGQHSFPFTYSLPDRIPTSIVHEREDRQYIICYKFKAFLVTEQPHTHEVHVHHHHQQNVDEHQQKTHLTQSIKKPMPVNESSFHTCKIERSCIFNVSELYPVLENLGGKSSKTMMHFETSKKYLFSAKKLKVSCDFVRTTFRIYDDDIVFMLNIDNQSTKNINSINVSLVQEFKRLETEKEDEQFNAKKLLEVFETKEPEVQTIVMFEKIINHPIASEETYEEKVTFELPSYRELKPEDYIENATHVEEDEDQKPPVDKQFDAFENRIYLLPSISNSKLIQCSYNIVVTCKVSLGPDLTLTCPVFIKPSLNGLIYPKSN